MFLGSLDMSEPVLGVSVSNRFPGQTKPSCLGLSRASFALRSTARGPGGSKRAGGSGYAFLTLWGCARHYFCEQP